MDLWFQHGTACVDDSVRPPGGVKSAQTVPLWNGVWSHPVHGTLELLEAYHVYAV